MTTVMGPTPGQVRLGILRRLDITGFRSYLADSLGPAAFAASDAVMLESMHKARYLCTVLEDHYRHESAAWLRQRNVKINKEELLPPGELPR
jgi:hypothetical protein